jgi:hypothetical protein
MMMIFGVLVMVGVKVGAGEQTKQQGGRAKDARIKVANDSTAWPAVQR